MPVENKNNSSSQVHVNVTPQNTPFSAPAPDNSYNPPDFMKQVIASVLTFKDDIPNLLRRIAYVLIAFMLILHISSSYFMYKAFEEAKSEIRENRAKVTSIYNKQRELLKALPEISRLRDLPENTRSE